MDILIHTFSGLAVGTAAAGLCKGSGRRKALVVFTGMVAGALPDIDAISLWSGFDQSIGSWLNLSLKGRDIYFGTYWYSHHAITHSLFAAIVCSLSLLGLIKLFKRSHFRRRDMIFPITFCLGYLAHLAGDLPTPASVWDGIQFWFPSSDWVGGSGLTWWWNNYDIFLLLVLCVSVNLIVNVANRWLKKAWMSWAPTVTVALCAVMCVYQLYARGSSFNYVKYEENSFHNFSDKSLEIQRNILGDRLYQMMRNFDESLPVNF